ncbi:MAG: family 20 glycosylhydrolase [Bryobacteraceae bacterium]
MPQPVKTTLGDGIFVIDRTFSVAINGAGGTDPRVAAAASRLLERVARQTGLPIAAQKVFPPGHAAFQIVVERKDQKAPQRLGDDESYRLNISSQQVRLSADYPLGVIRGMETFLQLIAPRPAGEAVSPAFAVPAVIIDDYPRFGWRGLSFDVSRHFIPVDGVKRTIDGMAAVKLNVLHWHLSDDQGIRVESKRYPKLQELGSAGRYYTQAEIREIVAYAYTRGIRIVPEFDVPGHATAILAAYPKLASRPGPFEVVSRQEVHPATMDPTNEATYQFLDGFVGEMSKLFPDEYFHIGGDEVDPKDWNANPAIRAFMKKHKIANARALQAYFNLRLQKIVAKHGKHMVGWDEILDDQLPKNVVIQSWRGQKALAQAADGNFQGLLSAGYYLDLMLPASAHYAVDPLKGETANLSVEQKKKILGGEAAMWEEIATAENIDAKLWPRLAAIAERLWSPEDTTDVGSMYRRLEATDRWLESIGLQQRTALERMRIRLAGPPVDPPGDSPIVAIDALASICEPVKRYRRHGTHKYSSEASFNRLVDAIPPESDIARHFSESVDRYLAAPDKQSAEAVELRKYLAEQLTTWNQSMARGLPLFAANSMLLELVPLAKNVQILSDAGIRGLDQFGTETPWSAEEVKPQLAAIEEAAKPQAEVLIQIAPAIRKLVEATAPAGTNPAP